MYTVFREKRSLQLCIRSNNIDRAIIFIPKNEKFTPMTNIDQLDNNPDFSGIIYALDIPETNDKVLQYFPDIPAYKWESRDELVKLSHSQ